MLTNLFIYREHYRDVLLEEHRHLLEPKNYNYDFPKARGSVSCFSIVKSDNELHLTTAYCIGVDWIDSTNAIYIEPKLNSKHKDEVPHIVEVDYFKMLFASLPSIQTKNDLDELFVIKWGKPEITIHQTKDFLTPLLILQYLNLLKTIVRKGLKKSYYKVEQNLNARVKGKILVGRTIKQNVLKNRPLYAYCKYDEFGVNGIENRLLKKALSYIKHYLPLLRKMGANDFALDLVNFITPAFENVSDDFNPNEIKHFNSNAFFKEYEEAMRLAKLILKRYGYNVTNVEKESINTPPFWIDMSKLFEYYTLGLLKDAYPDGEITFQFKCDNAYEVDYLMKAGNLKLVIDAKYKPKYRYTRGINKEDFRQIAGYARLKKVYDKLDIDYDKTIDCLVIYPHLEIETNNLNNLTSEANNIKKYVGFYKIGVNLPLI